MPSQPRMDVWLESKVRKLNDRVAEEMETLAEEGQELIQGYIETRGTANPAYGGKKSWKRTYYKRGGGAKSGPSRGRIWSGEMHADIEQSFVRGSDVYISSFGWLDNIQDYYEQQELGFDHPATGEHIAGMFAMSDAFEVMKQRFRDRIKRAVREF